MDAQLSGLVTLVSYGNLYLHRMADAEIERAFTRQIGFVFQAQQAMQFGDLAADAPPMAIGFWIDRLLRRQTKRLWLSGFERNTALAPHIAAAFANGIPVGIGVQAADGNHLLVPQSEFLEARRRWVTVFSEQALPAGFAPEAVDLDAQAREFAAVLEEIGVFAATVAESPHWRDRFFEPARQLLLGRGDRRSYLPRIGYGATAQRLYAAAVTGWVFGGMGSWNDMGFSNDAEHEAYDRISGRLYAQIHTAIAAATNAFDPAASS